MAEDEIKARYVALVWRCKGTNCEQRHLAKYLGEKRKLAGQSFQFSPPGNAVLIRCAKCDEQHVYKPGELVSMEVPSPLPAGYKEILPKARRPN